MATFTWTGGAATTSCTRRGTHVNIQGQCVVASSTAGVAGTLDISAKVPLGATAGQLYVAVTGKATTVSVAVALGPKVTSGALVPSFATVTSPVTGTTYAGISDVFSGIASYGNYVWPNTTGVLTVTMPATDATGTVNYDLTFLSPVG